MPSALPDGVAAPADGALPDAARAEVPGGPRGYQVLTACLHEEPRLL